MASTTANMDDVEIVWELEDGEINEDEEESVRNALAKPRIKPKNVGGHGSSVAGGKLVKSRARNNTRGANISLPRGGSGGVGPSSSRSTKDNFRVETKQHQQAKRAAFVANGRSSDTFRKHVREAAPLPPRPSFSPSRHIARRDSPPPPPYRRKEEPSRATSYRIKSSWKELRNGNHRNDGPLTTFGGRLDNRSRSKLSSPPRSTSRSTQRPTTTNRTNISDYTSKRHRFLSTIRRKSQLPPKPVCKSTSEEISYDDLLKQYQAIKSKLEDLNQEEDNQVSDISSDDLEDLDKENVKTSTKENKLSKNHEVHETHGSRCSSSHMPDAKPSSVPTRSSSCSSRNSTDSKPLENPEEEEEKLLRNLLLSTLKNRSNERSGSTESGAKKLLQGQAQSKLTEEDRLKDNYDDVEMELDSVKDDGEDVDMELDSRSSPLLFSEVERTDFIEPVPTRSPLIEDEDEDLLRAMLLSSLTYKHLDRTKVPDEPVPSSKVPLPVAASKSTVANRKTRTGKSSSNVAKLKMPASAPVHRPVVINLNEDSDSDTETDTSKKPSLLNIDDLLNSARQMSETNRHPNAKVTEDRRTPNIAPTASMYLPESDAKEYKRLRAEILKREEGRRRPQSATSRSESGAELTPGNNSPVRVPTPLIKDDSKLKTSEEILKKNRRIIWSYSRELKKLGLQIGSKATALSSTELKITKLKEQLTATTKIADAQRRQLDRMKQSFQEIEKQIAEKSSLQRSLELECNNLGADIYGGNYVLPTAVGVVPVKRKLSTGNQPSKIKRKFVTTKNFNGNHNLQVTFPALGQYESAPGSPNVKFSLEKIRLQKMEKEIASKLEVLRKKAMNVSSGSTISRKTAVGTNRNPGKVTSSASRQVTLVYDKPINGVTAATNSPILPKNPPTGLILTCRNDLALPSDVGASEDAAVAESTPAKNFSDTQLARLKEMQCELLESKPTKNAFIEKTYSFNLQSMFPDAVPKVKVKLPMSIVFHKAVPAEQFECGSYRSPLLHLRSYRFSPYFRTKANQCISWPTHSHKLKAMVRLCRFDLLGTCNDDKCPWQHERDYTMTPKEVLCDILSYCPAVADVNGSMSPVEMKTNIEIYVDKLQQSNQDRMTLDELCVLLVGRVNERLNLAPPHYCKVEPRLRLPSQVNGPPETTDVPHAEKRKAFKKLIIHEEDPDAILEDNDVRYFHVDGQVDSIEHALSESPNDTNMWLRLAHKKLNTVGCAPELCLDLALDVLSRGLEQNHNSSDLWLLYLSLYDKHDNNGDILQLCEQAVKFCSNYEVWWKYLQYTRGFVMKEVVCRDAFTYLLSSSEPPEILSHHLLELLLYRMQLHLLCGRTKTAITVLEHALGKSLPGEDSDKIEVVDRLVSSDCCLAWLCYVSLLEFDCLPPSLFGLSNGSLGKLINKTPFILPWDAGHRFKKSVKSIQDIFMDALRKCVRRNQSDATNVQLCLPLYKNLIALELCRGRTSSAIKACEQLLKVAMPDDVWILLASVHFKIRNFQQVRKTLSRALKSPEASPQLYCFAAMFEMSQNDGDAARRWVSTCATSLFDFPEDDEEVAVLDAVALYSKMLGLPVILSAKVPAAKSLQHIISQKPFIWLNYCIYLTVLGKSDEVKEAFEMALVRVTQREDLELVWMHYLQYNLCQLIASANQQSDFEAFGGLVHRCLSSVPSVVSLPGTPAKLWSDYTFFNSVVDLYASMLEVDQQIVVYERFHELSPKNDLLTDKLLTLYVQEEEYQKAWLLCRLQIQSTSPSLYVWNTTLHIAHREKSPSEAVKALPHVSSIWRYYIVFECLQNQAENARRLVIECKTYGIVLDDFFDQLLFS